MTIASEIARIEGNISAAYTAADAKGATIPSTENSDNLATCIASITTGSSPVISSLNVTPTTSAQTITAPSGTDGYSPINVSAVTSSIDANITAGNIKSGVSILGVSGSVTELKGETSSVSLTSSSGNTFTPSSGKNGITSITVTPNNQARTVTPSTSSQSLTINSGYSGNGIITVNAVTSSIDANITAGNIKKDVSILGVTGTYEGSGGGGEYPLTRISDDNGNEIGTAFMEFTDANGNKYTVVCLDAQYRNASTKWCSDTNTVTNMPIYNSNYNLWWYDNAKETATQNTQLILDFCTAGGYTSTACTHCRSQSFTIDGTTYYGQLPNMREVFDMWRHRVQIEQMDTSTSSHSSTNFSSARNVWSSNQYDTFNGWHLNLNGFVHDLTKSLNNFACPVLEIPLS